MTREEFCLQKFNKTWDEILEKFNNSTDLEFVEFMGYKSSFSAQNLKKILGLPKKKRGAPKKDKAL